MNKKNLISILIIILISGISTYLYFNKTKSVSNISTNTSATSSIFKIPELGIQIELPDSLSSDLIYTAESFQSLGSTTLIYLSTKTLTTKDAGCSTKDSPLGILSKTYGKYPEDANIENTSGELVKQFLDYYIGFSGPQSVCFNKPPTKEGLDFLTLKLKSFTSALSTITEIK